MEEHQGTCATGCKHKAWNKGKLIGAEPPLSAKHVWSIRRPAVSRCNNPAAKDVGLFIRTCAYRKLKLGHNGDTVRRGPRRSRLLSAARQASPTSRH